MSDLELKKVGDREFTIEPTLETRDGAPRIRVKLIGTADVRALVHLETLAPDVHAEVLRLGVRDVLVDVTSLEFMNSSCMKTFVTWIGLDQALEPAQQYRIHFISNPDIHWQRRSLHALSRFAADLVTVEP
ncbi:MAG: hypothetical protein H0T79_04230 [Deltaproteobacteria bacterium]|nr:hypothetical protein [Deltaproteobacteria bacterium]